MADLITDVVDQQAHDQIAKLQKGLDTLLATFNQLAGQNISFGGGSGGGSTAYVQALSELDKVKNKIVQTTERLSQAYLDEEAQLKRLQATQKEQSALNMAASGSIDAMKARMKELERQINATADAQGKGAVTIQNLAKEYNNLNSQVSKHEQAMGNFKRNVGNYASAYNGMSIAISQVAREMPNFAQSVQIGVMSLTNNIGGLVDGYKGLIAENARLAAAGEATIPIWRGISAAVLSWNTLIMVGVTALSLFLPKLLETKKAAKEAGDELDYMSKSFASGELVDAVSNFNKLATEIEMAKNGVVSKDKVLKDYNDTLGKTIGLARTLEEAEKNLVDTGQQYIQYVLLKNAADLLGKDIALKTIEAIKFEKEANESLIKTLQYSATYNGKTSNVYSYGFSNPSIQAQYGQFVGETNTTDPTEFIRSQVAKIKAGGYQLQDAFADLNRQMLEISKSFKSTTLGKGGSVNNKGGAIEKLMMDFLRGEAPDPYHNIWDDIMLEIIKKNPPPTELEKFQAIINDQALTTAERWMAALKASMQPALDKANKKAARKADFEANWQDILFSGFDISNSVIEGAKNKLTAMTEYQISLIDAREKAELDSLARMTMSDKDRTEKKIALELKYKNQRDKLHHEEVAQLRRMAIFQKGLDLSKIAINTAVAVSEDLGMPWKIAADIAIGAAMAAQVIAQQIPQYAKGTDNHKGGMAIVGEEGTELGILPSGKKFLTKNKPTLMNLPAKTKIIPHDQLVQSIYHNALIRMSEMGGVSSTDGMQEALIASVNDLKGEMHDIKDAILGKDMTVKLYGDVSKYAHLQRQLR